MATIPTGRGRQVMPTLTNPLGRGGPAPGVETGRALAELGQTAFGAGAAFREQDLRQQAEERHRQDKLREDAERAQSIAALGSAKIQLKDGIANVARRVLTGELDDINARSEWDGIQQAAIERATTGLQPHLSAPVTASIKAQAAELAQAELGRASEARSRGVARAGLLGALEGFERDALADRPKALALADAALQKLGDSAGLGPDEQFKLMQGLRERTAYNLGGKLMLDAGKNVNALEALQQRIGGGEFQDLSPEARERLEVRIVNRKQSILHEQEVQRNRAEAAAARQLREAEHGFKAAQSTIDGGAMLDDATAAALERKVAGTPYEGALRSLIRSSAERASFGSLAPAQQQEQLLALRSRMGSQGTNPAEVERLRTFESIAAKTKDLAEKDPLQWGLSSRLLAEVAPLDLSRGLEGAANALGGRIEQAQTVGAQLRRPVSPLLASEAQLLGEYLGNLPLDQKKGAVRTLSAMLPPDQQRALASQINEKDRTLALAMHAATLPKTSGADVVDLMLRGQDAAAAGRIKSDDAAAKLEKQQIAKELASVAWPTTKARDAAVEAAGLIYDGLRDTKGSGSRRRAVELATGGLADWGAAKVPVPPGWSESRFKAGMRALKVEDIERQAQGPLTLGGAAVSAGDLLKALPAATLVPLGPGQYAVDAGGLVLGPGRRPFVLTLGD